VTEVLIETPWERNEFVRARWMSKRLTWLDVLCALGFGILIWRNGGALVAAIIISIICYSFLRLLAWPIAQWSHYRDLKDQPIIKFNDLGVTVIVGEKSKFESWSELKSARETKGFYSVRKKGLNAAQFTIAKRMIADEEDEVNLRELMKEKTTAHLR
jgi:hypothetical protein